MKRKNNMANKNLFKSVGSSKVAPPTDTVNNAGGKAYSMSAKHALAQMASTGCFNDTFYSTGETQLKDILELAAKVSPEFVAKTAIYAREKAYMKDMPSFLLAYLSKHSDLFAKVLPRVVDNPKMLRNVVQMVRSGAVGRKSFGTAPKRAIKKCLSSWDSNKLFRGSIGNAPSLADVIKMVHPKPDDETKKALYGWLTGAMTKEDWNKYDGKDKEKKHWYDPANLPVVIQEFEAFKKGTTSEVPDVPFEMLTALPLTPKQWIQIAKKATWVQTRMNLNTFQRHGVFFEPGMDKIIADRLKNKELISKAKVFPYQLMVAYLNCEDGVPTIVKNALQEAMEHATSNVNKMEGKIYVCTDVSGSMSSPITGHKKGATSKVRCIDVAGLVASTILRRNPEAEVIPFEGSVVPTNRLNLNPMDSIMTNAVKLASVGGGSTNCSAPLALLNTKKVKGDLIIYISDNESWVDDQYGRGTATMNQWKVFKARNPKAKMICIDLTPNKTVQAPSDKSILNIGGFNDNIFELINTFLTDGIDGEYWTKKIEEIVL
jgi:60 kDa SS-A/Ro ribonucleoprotein